MRTPAPADLQRWSEELARNPGSFSFLPLARAYRRNGRRDLATRVCLRGLEHHPGHVEAHALLALLYLEAGDRDRAADEWSIVLRLKPGNFEALRGMGFRYLEQDDLVRARQHLERAALIRPSDAAVEEAIRLLHQRQERDRVSARPPQPPPLREPPPAPKAEWLPTEPRAADRPAEAVTRPDWSRPQPLSGDEFPFEIVSMPVPAQAHGETAEDATFLDLGMVVEEGARAQQPDTSEPWSEVPAQAPAPVPPPRSGPSGTPASAPHRLFDELLEGAPLHGALLLDRRGLVLAGSLRGEVGGRADEMGAILGGAIDDAVQTATHLALGEWRAMLLETARGLVHVSPVGDRGVLVIAATRDAPTGWVLRTAGHAAERAARFLDEEAS
jgi:predicted regulator of Ras-like GTPase activity (Roadblock/LC7/MglB family)